ncbi:MAG: RluA family pseudouridine synthase [Anaerotardibacter sp.]
MRRISYIVQESDKGSTVEQVLRKVFHIGRAGLIRAKKIENGITLDGQHAFTIHHVHPGQELSIVISDADLEPNACTIEPQEGPIDIVFEDLDVIALNKPADLVVHPSPGHRDQTLSNYLLHYFKQTQKNYNLHPCHRIDLGTSGLILFGTSSYSQDMIQKQLHTQSFQRTYLALCEGFFDKKTGSIEAPLDRLTVHPSTFGITETGKYALTHYRVLGECFAQSESQEALAQKPLSLVELTLETGRTHQIRIHMASIGHPLLGDATYGQPSPLIDRHALHSWQAFLDHPITKKRISLTAPLPQDMAQLLTPELRTLFESV